MSTDVVTAVDRRAMGDMPVWRTRTLLTVGVMTLCLMLSSEAVMAGNSRAKQAEEEMEFGYKAARRGYWQEALERFELADELPPNQPRILNNIAVALEANGRFEEARTTYQLALSLDPKNDRLQTNYARFLEFFSNFIAEEDEALDEDSTDDDPEPGDEG